MSVDRATFDEFADADDRCAAVTAVLSLPTCRRARAELTRTYIYLHLTFGSTAPRRISEAAVVAMANALGFSCAEGYLSAMFRKFDVSQSGSLEYGTRLCTSLEYGLYQF